MRDRSCLTYGPERDANQTALFASSYLAWPQRADSPGSLRPPTYFARDGCSPRDAPATRHYSQNKQDCPDAGWSGAPTFFNMISEKRTYARSILIGKVWTKWHAVEKQRHALFQRVALRACGGDVGHQPLKCAKRVVHAAHNTDGTRHGNARWVSRSTDRMPFAGWERSPHCLPDVST